MLDFVLQQIETAWQSSIHWYIPHFAPLARVRLSVLFLAFGCYVTRGISRTCVICGDQGCVFVGSQLRPKEAICWRLGHRRLAHPSVVKQGWLARQSWQRSTAPGAAHRANLKGVTIPEAPVAFADFSLGTLVGKFHHVLCRWVVNNLLWNWICSYESYHILSRHVPFLKPLCWRFSTTARSEEGCPECWKRQVHWNIGQRELYEPQKPEEVSSILGCGKRMRSVHCVCTTM